MHQKVIGQRIVAIKLNALDHYLNDQPRSLYKLRGTMHCICNCKAIHLIITLNERKCEATTSYKMKDENAHAQHLLPYLPLRCNWMEITPCII